MAENYSHNHDMGETDDADRVMAECGSCESAYAARRWANGKVQPIGSDRCSCGSTDFRVLDDGVTEDSVS